MTALGYKFQFDALSDFTAYDNELREWVSRVCAEFPTFTNHELITLMLKDRGGKANPQRLFDYIQQARSK